MAQVIMPHGVSGCFGTSRALSKGFSLTFNGGSETGQPSHPASSAFSAMLNLAVFEKSDFPAVALVVCSEEKVAHRFDRLFTFSYRRRLGRASEEVALEKVLV